MQSEIWGQENTIEVFLQEKRFYSAETSQEATADCIGELQQHLLCVELSWKSLNTIRTQYLLPKYPKIFESMYV